MAVIFRAPVAAIPSQNGAGATVLCDDGSIWELSLGESRATWTDLKTPLPGSACATGWSPEELQLKAGWRAQPDV